MTEGIKYDAGKPRFELLPPLALLSVAHVLTYGAQKYSADNWRHVENMKERYLGAAMRHVEAYRRGELLDPETGEPHLSHATCCLLYLIEVQKEETDDV